MSNIIRPCRIASVGDGLTDSEKEIMRRVWHRNSSSVYTTDNDGAIYIVDAGGERVCTIPRRTYVPRTKLTSAPDPLRDAIAVELLGLINGQ